MSSSTLSVANEGLSQEPEMNFEAQREQNIMRNNLFLQQLGFSTVPESSSKGVAVLTRGAKRTRWESSSSESNESEEESSVSSISDTEPGCSVFSAENYRTYVGKTFTEYEDGKPPMCWRVTGVEKFQEYGNIYMFTYVSTTETDDTADNDCEFTPCNEMLRDKNIQWN